MATLVAVWPTVALGEVIRQRKQFVQIDDTAEYKRCRVQLHAQGIVLRDIVTGAEVKTKAQQVCRAGEFLVAEIDAKVGGFGIVPAVLDGAIVSSHYFLFGIDESRLDRRFLDFYIRTLNFRDQVEAQGSTNYAAIRPADVLGYTIPLPPLDEQRRIVGRIEELTERIEQARGLRRVATDEQRSLIVAAYRRLYTALVHDCETRGLAELCTVCRGGSPRPKGDPRYFGGSIPWVMISDATRSSGKYIMETKETVTEEGAQRSRLLKAGTLVVTNSATVGLPKFLGIDGCIHDGFLALLDISPQLDPEFLYGYFIAMRSHLEEVAPLGTQRNLNTDIARALIVPVPSVEEQRTTVAYLDQLEATAQRLARVQAATAVELDALLPSVLDKAFRGEL